MLCVILFEFVAFNLSVFKNLHNSKLARNYSCSFYTRSVLHENGKLRQIWQQCNLVVETSITINVRVECCVIQLCVCISCCWIWDRISELLFCISVFAPMQSAGWCGVANVELNYGEIMQEPTNQPASIVLSHSQHQSTNSVDALCVRSSWHLVGENVGEFVQCQ